MSYNSSRDQPPVFHEVPPEITLEERPSKNGLLRRFSTFTNSSEQHKPANNNYRSDNYSRNGNYSYNQRNSQSPNEYRNPQRSDYNAYGYDQVGYSQYTDYNSDVGTIYSDYEDLDVTTLAIRFRRKRSSESNQSCWSRFKDVVKGKSKAWPKTSGVLTKNG